MKAEEDEVQDQKDLTRKEIEDLKMKYDITVDDNLKETKKEVKHPS